MKATYGKTSLLVMRHVGVKVKASTSTNNFESTKSSTDPPSCSSLDNWRIGCGKCKCGEKTMKSKFINNLIVKDRSLGMRRSEMDSEFVGQISIARPAAKCST